MKRELLSRLSWSVIWIFVLCLMAGCRGKSSDKPLILVSIEPQRKIVEELVGDRYEVKTLLAQGANPETFEPSVTQRMMMADAKFFVKTGFLPFESVMEQALGDDAVTVNMSEGIRLIHGTHSHGEQHGHDDGHHHDVDPHTWTSVQNVMLMASTMTDALIAADPDGAEQYRERLSQLNDRLANLDKDIAKQLKGAGVHAFAIWHPSLSYYARDYGLHQIAVGQESKEVSVGAMQQVIREAREDSVKVFFLQREYDSRQAESLNREIGSKAVTIDPLAYDWETELIHVTQALTE